MSELNCCVFDPDIIRMYVTYEENGFVGIIKFLENDILDLMFRACYTVKSA